jgi:hypothetical protein
VEALRRLKMIQYTGNGAYCYANSVHMCLQAAGAEPLPEPGFIECLTLSPFGASYSDALGFFPSPANSNPDFGVTLALRHAGWECEEWHADENDRLQALTFLGEALTRGPAMVGPLDMAGLSYHARRGGGDHYLVALDMKDQRIVVHDPAGFPLAEVPNDDLLTAWGARLGYGQPFTLRSQFRCVERLPLSEMTNRAVDSLRDLLATTPAGPIRYGGPDAFHRTADFIRGGDPPAPLRGMAYFALQLGAHRCQDAAGFLNAAHLPDAAAAMARKAELYGRAQYDAVRENWAAVAAIFDGLANAEEAFLRAMT